MLKEIADIFCPLAEKNIETINEIVRENLGVDVHFRLDVKKPSHTTEVYPCLVEDGSDTTRQLTATPLLRQIFADGNISVSCYYTKEENLGVFDVKIRYNHSFSSGSNGVDLMRFDMNMDTGKYRVFK